MQDIPYDVSHVPIDYDDSAPVNDESNKICREDERRERREQRAILERDVAQLQRKLIIEVNMRNALSRGLSRPLGSLPRIYASLPVETRELLLEVAVLEEEIISLEKQVIHLGREIEIEVMPVTDKETICQTPKQNTSPDKAESLVSSSVLSPNDSGRIHSKPSLSPGKPIDQKSNLSKPLFPGGKITKNKSSPVKVSIPPRNSLETTSSIKSLISPKDSLNPRRISTLVPPQKSQLQRNSSFPKVSLRSTTDLKSRRLSHSKNEPHRHDLTLSATHTVGPFIPKKLSPRKEDEESTPPVSLAPVSPSDVGKASSKPPRTKAENGKPPMTGNSRFRRKDPLTNKVAPKTRPLQAVSTHKLPGQDKSPGETPRLTSQPQTHGTILTRRTIRPSIATSKQMMDVSSKTSSAPKVRSSTPLNCDVSPEVDDQKPVDVGGGEDDTADLNIPLTGEFDGVYKPIHLSPDHAKVRQRDCSPERDNSNLGLEQVTESMLLSEEVVKLLETIYGNLQEEQPHLPSDYSGSSSQTSMSPSLSSASPDDYERRGDAHVNFRLDDCQTESFRTTRSSSMKFVRDCGYSGEIVDALDPYSYLNRGNVSNRALFHQRLMS